MFYAIASRLKQFILWMDFLFMTVLLYPLSFLPTTLTKQWYSPLFRSWCKCFIRALGVHLKLHQKNSRALPKQYILIGNHPSAFEDVGMPALFKARFLAKAELRHWWILGRISIFARTLYVQRESRDSRQTASTALVQALSEGDSIGLYPEGGCKGRRVFLPFRYGTFEAAITTGIPIIPVFIHYESQEDFEWKENETLTKKLWSIIRSQNKTANYYVFDSIDPKSFTDKEQLCLHVQSLYIKWQAEYLE